MFCPSPPTPPSPSPPQSVQYGSSSSCAVYFLSSLAIERGVERGGGGRILTINSPSSLLRLSPQRREKEEKDISPSSFFRVCRRRFILLFFRSPTTAADERGERPTPNQRRPLNAIWPFRRWRKEEMLVVGESTFRQIQ